jgi:hypothetical protein
MAMLSERGNEPSAPIRRLRLTRALQDCGKGMIDGNHHPNYQESTAEKFSICDDLHDKYTRIAGSEDDSNKTFDIDNPQHQTIVLLPFDHKLITGPYYIKGGIADCGLLSESELSFVEFKTEAKNPSVESIKSDYERAMNQLWHTFDVICERCNTVNDIDLESKVDIDFHIVNDKMFSRRVNSFLPVKVSSQQQTYQIQFQSNPQHPGYSLYFDNSKKFESAKGK